MSATTGLTAPDAAAACRPATLGARAYEALCDRLMGGEIAPGEKVSLRTLADGLGTSVTPVREAVARLVADGALEVSPNRAVAVPMMTLAAFRELTTVRIAVEGFAAQTAATAASAADLSTIVAHDAAFRAECASDRPDAAAALRANRDFHFAVYAAAGLPTLVAIIKTLWLKVGPVLNLDMRQSPPRVAMGAAEAHHAQCLDALRRHDGSAARDAIRGDIERTAAFIASTGRLPDTG